MNCYKACRAIFCESISFFREVIFLSLSSCNSNKKFVQVCSVDKNIKQSKDCISCIDSLLRNRWIIASFIRYKPRSEKVRKTKYYLY